MIDVNLLPKELQRVREPIYWRILAVLVPLVVVAVAGTLQYLAWQETRALEREVRAREDRVALLQPFIQEQQELQARQRELNDLLAVAEEVRRDRIVWTAEIAALLEHLPAQGDGARPAIDFRTLSMRALRPPQQNPDRYEGATVEAEMSVGGNVRDLATLAAFVRSLEDAEAFGVRFQNASRQGAQDDPDALYGYTLTVGAVADADEATEEAP